MADAFRLGELIDRLEPGEHDFGEFFRAPSGALSLTIAYWAAGAEDHQRPHPDDEIYYVAAGHGHLQIAADDVEVEPGTIAFVAAGVEHQFHDISEDLHVLVVWAPARSAAGNRQLGDSVA